MRQNWIAVCVGAAVVAAAGNAQAKIRLNDAQIMAGVLVVGGWTDQRGETVSLDNKFSAVSDKRRRFVFRVPYMPANCLVTLEVGAQTRTAVIANCGTIGLTGPRGENGPAGPRGEIGPVGPKGETGPIGPQGEIGPAGPKGENGPAGPQGEIGPTGPQGDIGRAGPKGDTGEIGPAGPRGETGAIGPRGEGGLVGAPGVALRTITKDCKEGEACSLTCQDNEVALAAVCPGGSAALDNPRTITCSNRPAATVTAFCAR
jgi:hypothetical protein